MLAIFATFAYTVDKFPRLLYAEEDFSITLGSDISLIEKHLGLPDDISEKISANHEWDRIYWIYDFGLTVAYYRGKGKICFVECSSDDFCLSTEEATMPVPKLNTNDVANIFGDNSGKMYGEKKL